MRDDPVALLERELVDAARRRVQPAPAAGTPPLARRRRGSLGAFAAVVLSGVAVVVALGAIVSLRGHGGARETSSSRPPAATVPGRQPLIDILGVLRRPQTPADVPKRILSGGPFARPEPRLFGAPDLALVRYATTTPWGERLYLVPMKPPAAGQPRRPETLLVVSAGGAGGAGGAATIEGGEAVQTEGGGGIVGTRLTMVVPDGVATVKFVLPRQPDPQQYGAPIYARSLTVLAAAHDNVVAVQLPRTVPEGMLPMIWYAADGHLVKRIGDLAGANRVLPTPQPGPETPLSRAAERDPSTPNRVWVTPSVGGPHTVFMVHFRVLLGGAGYSYALLGTRCPAITLNGGDGGGTEDLRGRIWSDVVDAVGGQTWCAGTYHLSVTIMNRPGARPFGSATFTVKP